MNKKAVNFGIVLLAIGLIIIAVGLVFYFSGDETKGETEQVLEELPRELSIDNLLFASYIDDDYNYEVRDSDSYLLGDDINLYFEVSGFMQELQENGKYRISLVEDLEIIGPDGEVILDEEGIVVINYMDLQEKASYVPLKNTIGVPQSYDAGKYKVKVTVTDKLTNKKAINEASFNFLDEFNVGNILFASYIDEDYNYNRKETPVYKIGEPVYIYFEVSGYEIISEAEGRRVRLVENIITKNEAGNIVEILNVKDHIAEDILGTDVAYMRYQEKFETNGLEPGSYSMEIIVFDDISKEKISRIVIFDLVK